MLLEFVKPLRRSTARAVASLQSTEWTTGSVTLEPAVFCVVPPLAQPYLEEKSSEGSSPKIGWEWMLAVGVFLGSLLSAWLSGDRTSMKVPPLWKSRFGSGTGKRFAAAFCGGAVMMFGARLAQGCTSGHGISGSLQLAVSSWLFVAVMFAAAVGTAFLLYGKKGAENV